MGATDCCHWKIREHGIVDKASLKNSIEGAGRRDDRPDESYRLGNSKKGIQGRCAKGYVPDASKWRKHNFQRRLDFVSMECSLLRASLITSFELPTFYQGRFLLFMSMTLISLFIFAPGA